MQNYTFFVNLNKISTKTFVILGYFINFAITEIKTNLNSKLQHNENKH